MATFQGHDSTAKSFTGAQILLGCFIVWQLFFLLANNLLGVLHDAQGDIPANLKPAVERLAPGWTSKKGHVWELTHLIAKVTDAWAEVSGQTQNWSLFAPAVGSECIFPALQLDPAEDPTSAPALARPLAILAATQPLEAISFAALIPEENKAMLPAPELWLSDNEPTDVRQFFRVGQFRLRRFENVIVLNLQPADDETAAETAVRWRDEIQEFVRGNEDLLHAYLRWRFREIQRRRTELPRQVILRMRRYHINSPSDPGEIWQGPYSYPVARWQPGVNWDPEYWPVEVHNPATGRFEGMLK